MSYRLGLEEIYHPISRYNSMLSMPSSVLAPAAAERPSLFSWEAACNCTAYSSRVGDIGEIATVTVHRVKDTKRKQVAKGIHSESSFELIVMVMLMVIARAIGHRSRS